MCLIAHRLIVMLCAILGLGLCAIAQTNESLLLEPWKGPEVVDFSIGPMVFGSSHFDSTHNDSYFREIESSGRFRFDTSRELNPTIGYDWTHIETDGSSAPIPAHLDDLSVVIASPLAKVGNWFIAATAGVGYAGDAAFGDGRGWYGKGSVMTGTELDKDTSLVLFLDYDGNRNLMPDLPLPGFVYAGKMGETFQYALGLPTSACSWTPVDAFELSISTYLFSSIDARAEYKISHDWKVFAKYADRLDGFQDSELPQDRRLFYSEKRIEGGAGYELGKAMELEIGIGCAFARQFATGFDDRDLNRITKISDEPYVRLGLVIHY